MADRMQLVEKTRRGHLQDARDDAAALAANVAGFFLRGKYSLELQNIIHNVDALRELLIFPSDPPVQYIQGRGLLDRFRITGNFATDYRRQITAITQMLETVIQHPPKDITANWSSVRRERDEVNYIKDSLSAAVDHLDLLLAAEAALVAGEQAGLAKAS